MKILVKNKTRPFWREFWRKLTKISSYLSPPLYFIRFLPLSFSVSLLFSIFLSLYPFFPHSISPLFIFTSSATWSKRNYSNLNCIRPFSTSTKTTISWLRKRRENFENLPHPSPVLLLNLPLAHPTPSFLLRPSAFLAYSISSSLVQFLSFSHSLSPFMFLLPSSFHAIHQFRSTFFFICPVCFAFPFQVRGNHSRNLSKSLPNYLCLYLFLSFSLGPHSVSLLFNFSPSVTCSLSVLFFLLILFSCYLAIFAALLLSISSLLSLFSQLYGNPSRKQNKTVLKRIQRQIY